MKPWQAASASQKDDGKGADDNDNDIGERDNEEKPSITC